MISSRRSGTCQGEPGVRLWLVTNRMWLCSLFCLDLNFGPLGLVGLAPNIKTCLVNRPYSPRGVKCIQ